MILSHLPKISNDFPSFSSNFPWSHPFSSRLTISFSPHKSSSLLLAPVNFSKTEPSTFPSAFPSVSYYLFSYSWWSDCAQQQRAVFWWRKPPLDFIYFYCGHKAIDLPFIVPLVSFYTTLFFSIILSAWPDPLDPPHPLLIPKWEHFLLRTGRVPYWWLCLKHVLLEIACGGEQQRGCWGVGHWAPREW